MDKLDVGRAINIVRAISITNRLVETKICISRSFTLLRVSSLRGQYSRVQSYGTLRIMQGALAGLSTLRDSQEDVLIRQVRVREIPEVRITRKVIFQFPVILVKRYRLRLPNYFFETASFFSVPEVSASIERASSSR